MPSGAVLQMHILNVTVCRAALAFSLLARLWGSVAYVQWALLDM